MSEFWEFLTVIAAMIGAFVLLAFMFLLFTPPGWVLLIVGAILIAG